MGQYINKSAIVAEIKEWLTEIEKLSHSKEADDEYGKGFCDGRRGAYRKFLSSINTLEVKEVDLDFQRFAKEMDEVFDLPSEVTTNTEEEPLNWEYAIAKHFFELGLDASNPLTWEDIKLIWTIGDEIPYMPEENFFKELLKRFKAQKGE